eukprot:NODE_8764_length_369_cov_0.726115.p3 GENE.NODE_8764_length_369_cov_0.726115~~NODE_8764_length_369_cov_0.726115.p3  ORF type:complete len:70 (-),score=2.92 NODE_8764_length_369_cov_0.726115:40-249(-)
MDELAETLGVGTCCGQCRDCAKQVLAEAVSCIPRRHWSKHDPMPGDDQQRGSGAHRRPEAGPPGAQRSM